jgi:hypothetical protein
MSSDLEEFEEEFEKPITGFDALIDNNDGLYTICRCFSDVFESEKIGKLKFEITIISKDKEYMFINAEEINDFKFLDVYESLVKLISELESRGVNKSDIRFKIKQ